MYEASLGNMILSQLLVKVYIKMTEQNRTYIYLDTQHT